MTPTPLDAAVRHVRGLLQGDRDADLPDRVLLERFVTGREEAAFTALVRRHGPLVLGVCRRVLGQEQDAEDAFQATFLILARKAGSVRKRDALAGWLYGVAHRVARKARTRRDREKPQPTPGPASTPTDPAAEVSWREVCAALEEELARLPERYRAPMVLCYLEGRTRDDAAQRLGWSPGRVKVRLERGRRLLRGRLARRGITLSLALLAAALAPPTWAAVVPAALALAAVRLALQVAGGQHAVAPAAVLAAAVLRDLARASLATALAVVLAAGLVAAGLGVLAQPKTADEGSAPPPPGAQGRQPRQPGSENALRREATATEALIAGTVEDSAGHPIPGARVLLREWRPPKVRFRSTDADAQGHFRFSGVSFTGMVTLADAVVAVAPGHSLGGRMLYLLPGQFDDLHLVLAGPHDLHLRVIGEDGKPIQGATPGWMEWDNPRRGYPLLRTEPWTQETLRDFTPLAPEVWKLAGLPVPTSDQNGELIVPGIPDGAVCQGVVQHPDFARQQFTGATPSAKPITVRLERGWQLRVIAVDDTTGKRAPAATVNVLGTPYSVDRLGEPVGPDGELTVLLPKGADVSVEVHHPELIATERGRITPGAGRDRVYTARLRRRAKARGRVVDERTGKPLAGVNVHLVPAGAKEVLAGADADASGTYEIVGPEGPAEIRVPNGMGFWSEENRAQRVQLDHTRVARVPDLMTRRLATVRGAVVLPNGRPAGRSLVFNQSGPVGGGPTILTDAMGRFELPLQYPDTFFALTACHLTQRLSGGTGFEFYDRQKNRITFERVERGNEVRIQLQPESVIRGTVVDDNGKPREGVRVWLRTEVRAGDGTTYGEGGSDITDREGRYRFAGLNRYCRYRVTLEPRRYDNLDPTGTGFLTLSRETVVVPPLKAPAAHWPAEKPSPRQAAPELACRAWLNSPPLKLTDLRGKVVLLDFWATWSAPCTAELPKIKLAHELFADKGLIVIGIHHHAVPLPEVAEYVKKHGLTYPIGLDDADGSTCRRYNVIAFPSRVLIGRDGKVVGEPNTGDLLEAARREVLYGDERGTPSHE